jgi:hypothetical protein
LNGVKINGRANQDSLEFHLLPGTWQKKSERSKVHAWFEATGQWRDARLRGNHKVMTFQVRSLKEIEPVTLRFEDFRDRQAKFTGTVMKDGLFSLGEETAKLEGMSEWPAQVIGKDVTVRGIVKQTGPDWQFSAASWQLEKVADQIGQEVALDGVLWSQNGGWWFEYRGEPVWLLDERGSISRRALLPGDFSVLATQGYHAQARYGLGRGHPDRPANRSRHGGSLRGLLVHHRSPPEPRIEAGDGGRGQVRPIWRGGKRCGGGRTVRE